MLNFFPCPMALKQSILVKITKRSGGGDKIAKGINMDAAKVERTGD